MNPRNVSGLYIPLLLFILLTSCSTKQYFTIEAATYQPAVFDESSRITNIEVIVSNVDTNVLFSELVFQNLRIPVTAEEIAENRVLVTGYIQIGGKLADDHYQVMTEEPNKLIFTVDKRRNSIPLENIERQSTALP